MTMKDISCRNADDWDANNIVPIPSDIKRAHQIFRKPSFFIGGVHHQFRLQKILQILTFFVEPNSSDIIPGEKSWHSLF